MKIRGLRWLMIGLIFLATVINYIDRQTVSVLKTSISQDLGLSNIKPPGMDLQSTCLQTLLHTGVGPQVVHLVEDVELGEVVVEGKIRRHARTLTDSITADVLRKNCFRMQRDIAYTAVGR